MQLNFRTSLYIYIAAVMLVDKICTPVHFQNPQNVLACNSAFICPNDFKFGTETLCIIVKIIQKIDHNLHNNVFYDIICKPSIGNDQQEYFESIAFLSKVIIVS